MGLGSPSMPDDPPPPANAPTQASRSVIDAGNRQRQAARAGFSSTLLTGPVGVLTPASTTRGSKSLLGE